MDAVGLDYLRDDNCFPWIEDWPTAQQLMDQQLKIEWPALLDAMARTLNPIHAEIFEARPTHYSWSTYQSEWAIDLSFRTPEPLRRLYPRLLQHSHHHLRQRRRHALPGSAPAPQWCRTEGLYWPGRQRSAAA
jgi:hypothetical protein